jgi:hypothetical protein
MTFNSKVFWRFACAANMAAMIVSANAQDPPPTIIPVSSAGNTGAAPNGIAVTASELLFTQPFCAGQQTRGIYKVTLPGGGSTFVPPSIPDMGQCSENYLAISTGLGGFTANDTFVTGPSINNPSNEAVYKNGSTLFVDALPASNHHAGVTFDTAGTFGLALIVTLEGSVNGYNSTGLLQFTYPLPTTGVVYVLEGATVAPLTYGACPGCLFITGERSSNVNNAHPSGAGAIFFVKPGTVSGTPITKLADSPGVEPEGLVFVGNNLSCSLDGYSYFVSGYATGSQIDNPNSTTGAILAFTPAQLAPVAGQFLVPDEGSLSQGPGVISAFSPPSTFTTFSSTAYQLEASTILQCVGTGCPATFGFWKHHAFPASMFTGGVTSIGCHNYTAAELVAILDTNNAGGNAVTILAHQLIAAIANYDAGAKQTSDATAAIGAAIALLCANNIDMSTDFVQSSTTLGQQMTALANTLDTYNSSAPNCEGTGLTTGASTK